MGKLIASRNLTEFGFVDPQGLTFAPSGDTTDAPSAQSLFIADSGKGNAQRVPGKIDRPAEGVGRVIELSMAKPPLISKAASVTASIIQTINTANFNPFSPDPAGITFLNSTDNLLLADSEVSETPYFGDDNLFELSLQGTLLDTSSILTAQGGFTNEATGLSAINPANQHLFITDDDKRRIFELAPGSDGQYGTPDDQLVHTVRTSNFGSTDPEGVAFNPGSGKLYIAGGISAEVYIIAPGANGNFGDSDDVFSQFDTFSLGLTDPEGITYDTASGHLFVVGEPKNLVFELTTQGSMIRTIDISAAFTSGVPKNPAGLTFAPDSQGSLNRHLYIADRGIDNDFSPSRSNDGKIYEVAFPPADGGGGGNNNQLPQIQAGGNITLPLPTNSVELSDANVSDDGRNLSTPNLSWTVDSGPGSVTFSPNSTTLNPTASFSTDGTYSLRLTANDGEFSPSDTVTVNPDPGSGTGNTTLEKRIASSSDDAEEKASGNMRLTSSDLELVFDGSHQTVGIRFSGMNIPQGAAIQNAWIQFQTDEVNSGNANLSIRGHTIDNAPAFNSTNGNISSRNTTSASANWIPSNWTSVGAHGAQQRTPNMTAIIQEIVNRSGWSAGNALAIIITGTGERTAESFNGNPAAAPLLHIEYGGDPVDPVNQPPSVEAGSNKTITLPTDSINLNDANVSDDGLNLPAPNLSWTLDNGPGSVSFSPNNAALNPTASFSATGIYTLRLTADDGEFSNSDTLTVSVNPETGGVTTIDVRIAADSDDAEEKASGGMRLTSSDLELVFDGSNQTVGMRFTGLNIPQGIAIRNAWVQFQTDEINSGNSNLSIRGQTIDHAPTFSSNRSNISSRNTTSSTIAWAPDHWIRVGEQSARQQTPSITAVIQEIINRPGWSSGNALAIIITGSGERTAESFHGNAQAAPLLHIEY